MPDMILFPGFRGLRTALDPTIIGNGYFTKSQNLRFDSGVASVRAGSTLAVNNSFSTETCVGAGLFKFGGNVYYLFAMDDGAGNANSVEVYWALFNGSTWGSFATTDKILNNTKYGDNRMYTPADGYVTFTGVPDRDGVRYVVIQNGIDTPRVIDLNVITSGNPPATGAMVFHEIDTLDQAGSQAPQFGANGFLDVTASTPTHTESDANFAWADTGTPKYWTLTTSGTIAAGETALVYTASDVVDLTDSDQIWLVYNGWASDKVLTSKLKWELRDGSGNYHVIHDPANGVDSAFTVNLKDNIKILSFSVSALNQNASAGDMDDIRGFRVTAAQPLASTDLSGGGLLLYAVVASGRVPGGAQYQISPYHSTARYEGPSVVLPNPQEGSGLRQIFGTTSHNLPEDFTLPIVPELFYQVEVPVYAPTTTDRDRGLDSVRIYRQDPNESDFYLIDTVTTASYSGSWAYASPFTAAGELQTHTDVIPTWLKDYTTYAPGAFVEAPPIGLASAYFAGRLAVGMSTEPKIKVSDRDFPFRFRSVAIGSGEPGYESVIDNGFPTAIYAGSASVIGGGFAYVFTKRGLYQIADTYVQKVASIGTLNQYTVDADDNVFYFVDSDLQVRRMSGGIAHLSRYRVSDKVTANSTLQRWGGKLYVRNSATSTLVYSDGLEDWESEDTNSLSPSFYLRWNFYDDSKLFFVSNRGVLYQYESGATDAGTQIMFSLKTKEYVSGNYNEFRSTGNYVLCDAQSSETLTTTITSKSPVVSSSGTVNVDGSGLVWKKDSNSGKDTGVRGIAISHEIGGTVQYPFKLYSWKTIIDTGGRGAIA